MLYILVQAKLGQVLRRNVLSLTPSGPLEFSEDWGEAVVHICILGIIR